MDIQSLVKSLSQSEQQDLLKFLQYEIEVPKFDILNNNSNNISKIESESHDMGWGCFIKNLKIIDIPGNHDTLFKHNHIESTANAIKITINSTCFDDNLFEEFGDTNSPDVRKKRNILND